MRGNFITPRNGSLNANYKDGRKGTRLYSIYRNMRTRCYNKNTTSYKYYGARGITVCNDWLNDYKSFSDWAMSNGYRDDLTLDRINYDKGYSPDNCRWVTTKVQSNNTRRNHYVTLNGITKTLKEWSEFYNINYRTVRDRLIRGWNYYDALTKEVVK